MGQKKDNRTAIVTAGYRTLDHREFQRLGFIREYRNGRSFNHAVYEIDQLKIKK
jgi:hypothetical protein